MRATCIELGVGVGNTERCSHTHLEVWYTGWAELVRQNLYICLRGTALGWYTGVLKEDQERLVKLRR